MGNVCSCSVSLDNLLISCFDRIVKQPNYAFKLGERLAHLENDWNNLKRRRTDIKARIEVEERDPQMKRLAEVDGWRSCVDAMEVDVDALIRAGSQESVNKCLVGCCPKNCKTSYKLGKKVVEKQLEVTALFDQGNFAAVTQKVALPRVVDERPSEPTFGLKSTLDEVWSFIEDEQVGMIGLYGLGGVGKTTLLTQVNNKLSNLTSTQGGFDVVIWIVVTQTPNLSKLQDAIGKKIGLDGDGWKNKSEEDKAVDIFRVLKENKFVLLLDDMWKRLDLKNLGIPSFPNQNNKSKVVFTTRSKGVCGHMGAHKYTEVKCLTWEDSWQLFKENVRHEALETHTEIHQLAKDVAKECDGLPLALITIGSAMACKTTIQEWEHDLNLLKTYTSKFSDMEDKVFSCLKFSYDALPDSTTIRSCFLYCSLYPEDYEIPKKELIDYWIGEGLLVTFNNLRDARNEGYGYIGALVRASLLEECSPENVKMHDVIRDTAIWIACDCGARKNNFFVKAGVGLSEMPNVEEWEGAERVSLMRNEIKEVTLTPCCPNLLTFFLNNNICESITIGFFQYMSNLRVLNLSGNSSGCTSSILKEICELVTLQYLNLSWTQVEELPTEFQNLINVKYLNLSFTNIRIIGEGVLSSLKKLQMLKLVNFNNGVSIILMKELESLENLNELEISIESDFGLSYFLSSEKLMRITTTLMLVELRGTRYIDMLVLKEMRRLESLDIFGCSRLEELRMGKGKAVFLNIIKNHNYYFPQLRESRISNCQVLKDITWLAFAPNLETIYIFDCSGMKEVVGGWKLDEEKEEDGDHQQINMEIIPFAKLTTLLLDTLPELESIYPTALPFPCLKDLTVYQCPKLKKLPLSSSSNSSCKSGYGGIRIKGYEEWWNGLEWEDEATRLAFLPSFKPFSNYIEASEEEEEEDAESSEGEEEDATRLAFLPSFKPF